MGRVVEDQWMYIYGYQGLVRVTFYEKVLLILVWTPS